MTARPVSPRWDWWARLVALGARTLVRVLAFGRVRVEGLDRPLPDGPLIIVSNHLSNADPPLVGGWLAPTLRRRPRFLAKSALFVGPMGWFLRSQGVIPVRAGGSDVDAYRAARGILDEGGVMVIFPEGTRSRDGALGQPLPGVASLATRGSVPILPVGVSNTDRLWGRGSRVPRFGTRITLRVGEPFTLAVPGGRARREALNAANEDLMSRIAALVDERHRGRFGTG